MVDVNHDKTSEYEPVGCFVFEEGLERINAFSCIVRHN